MLQQKDDESNSKDVHLQIGMKRDNSEKSGLEDSFFVSRSLQSVEEKKISPFQHKGAELGQNLALEV